MIFRAKTTCATGSDLDLKFVGGIPCLIDFQLRSMFRQKPAQSACPARSVIGRSTVLDFLNVPSGAYGGSRIVTKTRFLTSFRAVLPDSRPRSATRGRVYKGLLYRTVSLYYFLRILESSLFKEM